MGITKNAIIRYNTLDKCFANTGRNYTITNLLEECNNALIDFDPKSKGIQKRQLYDDIRFMESAQGWSICIDKIRSGKNIYYRYEDTSYSINNQPINALEADQLKSAMLVLSRFKGLPQFEWVNELLPKLDQSFQLSNQSEHIISFETNEFLRGLEYISPIFKAILYKQVIIIKYKSFKNDFLNKIVFHPYHLKQFNQRWYVFGKNSLYNNITTLALDRIEGINTSVEEYNSNFEVNFSEYFEDIIGVSKYEGIDEIKIVFHASKDATPYIKTKPLHGSQKKIKEDENGFTFSLDIIPNSELERLILSYSDELEVVSPDSFRNRIKERISKLHTIYFQQY